MQRTSAFVRAIAYSPAVSGWQAHIERGQRRYRDAMTRGPHDKQLVRAANAAWGAAAALLMVGRTEESSEWFTKSADAYRRSYEGAPKDSWGRPVGALKARLLAGDAAGAAEDARWALDLDAEGAESPVGRYAATLALLVLGADAEAGHLAQSLQDAGDAFPRDVADALRGLGAGDSALYADGLERVLRSFEERHAYLENVPVADTVLVLEILAESRGLAARPSSPLVP